jgi:hypothetical protein
MRQLLVFSLTLTLSLLVVTGAAAAWLAAGAGEADAQADIVLQANKPTATLDGRDVEVEWGPGISMADGTPVQGYEVRRYPAENVGSESPALADCDGLVQGVVCVETDTPPGDWRYTVTARLFTWSGSESALSGVVTVPRIIRVSGLDGSIPSGPNQIANVTVTVTDVYGSAVEGASINAQWDSGPPTSTASVNCPGTDKDGKCPFSRSFSGNPANVSLTVLSVEHAEADYDSTENTVDDLTLTLR